MAVRVHRFAWDNKAIYDAVIYDASSALASAPLAYLRIPRLTVRWRSLSGYNVVANWNDRFRFRDNGVLKDASLTVGNYATPADYALMVQTAINAAGGLSNTYTFTYLGSGIFRFARATGASTCGVYGVDGDTGRSAHADAGYLDTDHTGATTYDSDFAAYHSREWIRLDMGASGLNPGSLGLSIVAGFSALTTSAIKLLFSNTLNVWTAASQTLTYGGDDMANKRYVDFVAGGAFRYWFVLIKDQSNPLGYSDLAVPFIGNYFTLDRGLQQGWRERGQELTLTWRADQGGFGQDARPTPREVSGNLFRVSRASRDTWRAMVEAVKIGGHLFYFHDFTNYPMADTLYGVLTSERVHDAQPGDGVPAERFNIALSICQEVQ